LISVETVTLEEEEQQQQQALEQAEEEEQLAGVDPMKVEASGEGEENVSIPIDAFLNSSRS
jgi:hypothetical protein